MDSPCILPQQQPPLDLTRWHCQSCGCTAPNLLVLPSCGHVFCTPCVDQWLWTYVSQYGGQGRKYPCQVCSVLYKIPPDGLDAFLQNIHVLRLQLELEQFTMTTSTDTSNSGQTTSSSSNEHHEHFANQPQSDIMQDVSAARSGDFSSGFERKRCALLPVTSYCQMPNHMF